MRIVDYFKSIVQIDFKDIPTVGNSRSSRSSKIYSTEEWFSLISLRKGVDDCSVLFFESESGCLIGKSSDQIISVKVTASQISVQLLDNKVESFRPVIIVLRPCEVVSPQQ